MKLNRKQWYLFVAIIFFCTVFYYFYFLVDHIIYYQNSRSIFLFDLHFFKDTLRSPGGITTYLSSFLIQFFYYKSLGVLVICLLLIAVAGLTYKICDRLGIVSSLLLYFIPPLLIISLYIGNSLESSVGTIFALSSFYIFLKIDDRNRAFVFSLIAFVLLYFIAAGYSFVFLASVVMYESVIFRNKKSLLHVPLYVLLSIAVPLISVRWIYVISVRDSFVHLLPLYPAFGVPKAQILHLIFLPLLPVVSLIRIPLKGKGAVMMSSIVPFLMFCFLTVYVYKVSINDDFALIMDVEKFAMEEDWLALLELSADNPNSSDINAAYTNLALYKIGRLSYDMYRFNHMHFEDGLVPKWRDSRDVLMPGSDIYFHLGLSNASYRWAFEYMVSFGESPRVLKRLAMTSLINRDYVVAEKYFSILDKTLFHKKWVRKYEVFLNNESAIDQDPYLGFKARNVIYENSFVPIVNNQHNYELLLRADPWNKMAYEYLISHLLFKKDLEAFAKQIVRIGEYDYTEMPVLWGEALMVHNILFDENRIKLEGFPVSNESYKRFEAYSEVFPQYLKSREQGAIALRKAFGDTYWFYHHFEKLQSTKKRNSQRIDR